METINEKCCTAANKEICCDDKTVINLYVNKGTCGTGCPSGSGGTDGSGTYDHDQLENRNLGIQHDASAIGFTDGETFQEKYDKGELTGSKGEPGQPGESGEDGFSPEITIIDDTDDTYKLNIKTSTDELETPNLKGPQGEPGKGIDEMPHAYYDTLITGKETLTNQWRDGKPVYQMLVDYGLMPQGVTAGISVTRKINVNIPDRENAWIDTAYIVDPNNSESYHMNFSRVQLQISNNNQPGVWIYLTNMSGHSVDMGVTNSAGNVYNKMIIPLAQHK